MTALWKSIRLLIGSQRVLKKFSCRDFKRDGKVVFARWFGLLCSLCRFARQSLHGQDETEQVQWRELNISGEGCPNVTDSLDVIQT